MKSDKKIIIEENFDKFNPREYLNEYYTHIGAENNTLLHFLVDAYSRIPEGVSIIEFGGGPTIYQLISAATKAREIYFSDYLESNIAEIKLWKNNARNSFNWDKFFRRTLELETLGGNPHISHEQIRTRENLLRQRIKRVFQADAFQSDPLGEEFRKHFDVLSSHFVAEGITTSKEEWKKALINMCSLLKSNGIFITSIVKNCRYWHVANRKFLAIKVDENDVREALEEIGFYLNPIYISTIPAETTDETGQGGQGYDGIISVLAKKK